MRDRIIATAHTLFRDQGQAGTSVADIAQKLAVKPAYVYKFFSSKRAIAEAVCGEVLDSIGLAISSVHESPSSATERLTSLYLTLLKESVGMFFAERKLHEMVANAIEERWAAIERHRQHIDMTVMVIVTDGIRTGEFDASLDVDLALAAIGVSLFTFANPLALEQRIDDDLEHLARAAALFAIRGLRAPATLVTD